MKRIFTLSMAVLTALSVFAQAPQKMSYQCVVRNASGALVTNQNVGLKISILQGTPSGTVIFSETYSPNPQTNANGMLSIEIGGGFAITGTFSAIDWAAGPYFLKTETDPTGGTSYTITGTSQLLSVPYALHAKTAATANYNDLSNLPSLNISNWNTAYGWGNHAGLYRPVGWVPAWGDVTGKPAFATVATSGSYTDLSNKPTILNSQWTTSGSNIYFNTGKVGIGIDPGSSSIKFRVYETANQYAIYAENNGSTHTIYSHNNGSGAAGYFTGNTTSYSLYSSNSGSGPAGYFINNSSGYTLYSLNSGTGPAAYFDGSVTFGGGNTSEVNRSQTGSANILPICYGSVEANGTKNTGGSTANFTVTKVSTGVYDITITGETYDQAVHTAIASLGDAGFINTNAYLSKLRVYTYSTSYVVSDREFSFVVYKP